MKKKIVLVLAIMMIVATLAVSLIACSNQKYVANAVATADIEEYGLCISKTSTLKDEVIAAMNKVIAEVKMDEIVAYYTALSNGETPTVTLKTVDLSDNTQGTLEVYTCSGFEPYEFVDANNKVIGVDMYLMELVAEELNMKININDMDFDGIVAKVKTENNAIGAAGITITDDRKEEVVFSKPYYSSVQYIISKDTEAYTSLEQLKGKKIGVQKGTTGAEMVDKAIKEGVLKDTGAQIVEYDTGAVAFVALKAGKCDYVVIDELPAKKLVG